MNSKQTAILSIALFVALASPALIWASLGTISGKIAAEPASTPLRPDRNVGAYAEDALISKEIATIAPPLTDGRWINSGGFSLDELKGKVVYLEFWTFGCFNCINTLPSVRSFDKKFRDQGLTIIGIETPELDYERSFENLVAAVRKRGIEYPVLTDYASKNWEAYNVNAWPTIVIIDKQGLIRYRHVGEGAYDTQEKVIESLLAE